MKRASWLLFFSLGVASTVHSQISPGDLAAPHADLEGIRNCIQCHSLGGGPDSQNCLKCHREIQQTLALKRGYHFFVTRQRNRVCFECHSDHNGRDFEMIFWPDGKESFNHGQTGFQLEGKHLVAACKACHQPKNIVNDPGRLNKKVDINRTFLGLSQDCLTCHRDAHQGQLPKTCLECHNYTGWKPAVNFDHNRAKFRLTGKHQKVECARCHPTMPIKQDKLNQEGIFSFVKYVDLEFRNCTPCHRDVHNGRFGQNCQQCHDSSGWRQIDAGQFDHALTRFPLVGLHQRVGCQKCHGVGNKKMTMPFATCIDCHKDVHFGQFAGRADRGQCESCHNVFGFVPAGFDVGQHNQTDYPLTGAHLAVPCISCHTEVDKGTPRQRRIFDFADISCRGCHQDVHKGQFAERIQLGGCESCHQTSGWAQALFDHNMARFPLLGKHAEIQCRKCHKPVDVGTAMHRILFRPMETACLACHEDVHLGQFQLGRNPKTCDQCHAPTGWVELTFDHNRDSLFKLRQAHEKVPCADCHKVYRKEEIRFVLFKPMDRRCVSCHG